MNSLFHLEEKFEKSWTKKMDAEDEILMVGYLLMRKRRNHQQKKQRSEKYFCCVTRCHSMYHSLSFVITRCTTLLSFYKWSFLNCFNTFKSLPKFCLLIHFRWVDVKSSRCFGGLSLISIILWEYCEKNIKTFWYYSYENKQIISQKVVR